MGRDLHALRDGEELIVVGDVEQRLVDLADVVKQCHPLDARSIAIVEATRVGEDERVAATRRTCSPVPASFASMALSSDSSGGGEPFGGFKQFAGVRGR